jgi:CP family cyanate transporter-like MFS transporter
VRSLPNGQFRFAVSEPTEAPSNKASRRRIVEQLTALFLVAFNLRIAMACIGPVIDDLRRDLDMSYAQLGFLSTLPVLCMSLFAPFAQRLSSTRGPDHAILVATVLMAVAVFTRAWATTWIMLLSAFVAGTGIAIAGTLLNTFVKQHYADRSVLVSGLYSAALCLGAALAAGFTAPIESLTHGSWRTALAIWSIPGFIAAWVWRRMILSQPHAASRESRPTTASLPWKRPRAWVVTFFFGLQSVVFYVVLAWLAPMYISLGWSAERAGALLSYWIAAQVIFIFIVARIASRSRDRRPWLAACSIAAIVAMTGFAFTPLTFSSVWVVLLGFACGGWFPLCMNLPLDYGRTPSEAGSWTAMMLCGGYLLSAFSPSLAGWARDEGHSYPAIFWTLSALSLIILLLTPFLRPTPADSSYFQASE